MKKIVLTAFCFLLSSGIAFGGAIFTDISSEVNNQSISVIGDVNGDGWADLLNGSGVWLNKGEIVNGRPTFQLVQTGLDFTTASLSHLILVDIDGDGDKDLVAAQRYGDARLYRNDSCGNELRFVDVTTDAGLGGNIGHEQTHVALGDIDRDGDLDIFASEGWPSGRGGVLYRNDTDAAGVHFKNVTSASGIVAPPVCRTILFVDFDADGDADLYLGSSYTTNANKFYLNQGDINNDGVADFVDVTAKAGLNYYGYDNGATAGDVDNDGDVDIIQALAAGAVDDSMRVFLNQGDINGDGIVEFKDLGTASGIAKASHHGVGLGDVDNDGDLDLADASFHQSPLQFYANNGDGTFTNITTQSGIGYQTYGVITLFADIDNDGDLDLWMNKLFMNNTNNAAYLKVELLGKGLNRDAVGAKLRVWPAGTSHSNENLAAYREVTAGTAFFSSDDAILELGLSPGTYDLEATFASGAVQSMTGAATGQSVRILEDSSVFFPKKCGNHDPTSDAGPDQTVECASPEGSVVTLDGSGSSDPDGNALTYTWKEGELLLGSGPTLSVTLGQGNHTITLTVDDGNGGTNSDDVKVTVQDTTPPQSMINGIAGTIGNNGWHRSAVTVNITATDACSGVQEIHYAADSGEDIVMAGGGASLTITQDGVHGISYYARDRAGNTETPANQHYVKIDQTAPVITATTTPAPNEYGWNKTDVLVTFTCTDSTSGVASCTAPITITGEGAGQSATGTAVDQAGNEASVSSNVNIDRTPPLITATVAPAANKFGWHNTDVIVIFACRDDFSDIASCPDPITVTTEGAGQVVSGTATDKAGNSATASVTLNIDKTAPVVNLSVNPDMLWPPNHKLVTVTPSISAVDALDSEVKFELVSVTSSEPDNGLGDGDTANDIVLNGDGSISLRAERSGSGPRRIYTITYLATDDAGNSTTASTTVTVPHNK